MKKKLTHKQKSLDLRFEYYHQELVEQKKIAT